MILLFHILVKYGVQTFSISLNLLECNFWKYLVFLYQVQKLDNAQIERSGQWEHFFYSQNTSMRFVTAASSQLFIMVVSPRTIIKSEAFWHYVQSLNSIFQERI